MKQFINQKIGILGGGQLGKMLCQAGSRWGLDLSILDERSDFPAGQVCPQFAVGSFRKEDDVYQFGRLMDVLTIEIEHVSVPALDRLVQEGVAVYPSPSVLRIIQDKGLQKIFYRDHHIPTSPFQLMDDATSIRKAVESGTLLFPFVQKIREAGYDGRGVAIIRTSDDLPKLLEGPSLIEDMVPMTKELAVVVARDVHGQCKAFPTVEMEFHQEANLVEFLSCPADITADQSAAAEALAIEVAQAFGTVGLLAVELFLTTEGQLLVNEVAPRPHNSGHHTIECCETSQYEQHLRAITGLPLGDTHLVRPGVMLNLLGEEGFTGPAVYRGWDECIAWPGVHVHLYGKAETRPYRKMGHVTVVADTLEEARDRARIVRDQLKVIA
ncbi:MAG: 5-(carboxyamino)imidazole ribonucleotide synthase [Saprospiraceae bacterium]|nr:5-(carboxyamino)imidazole ribonucleotide synthase [Saprospiraceae bacterium]